MKLILTILILVLILINCSEKETLSNGKVVNMALQPFIQINSGDILKVNLGSFGDEEGAWILKYPRHAKLSNLYREPSSSLIYYEYSPLDNFPGKDSVILIMNRGSDGASAGINDTTKIYITTK